MWPGFVMGLLLDLVYLIAFVLVSPWILYRLVVHGGWRVLGMRCGIGLGEAVSNSVWLHGSSAGEVSLLKPLIALLERDFPATPLVISTFTSTGLQAATAAYPQHRVICFPLDLTWLQRRFLKHFDPRLVVIVESEFWPNFLMALRRRKIPAVVLNGKMSEKSYRIHARTRIVPRMLCDLKFIAVQSTEHAARIRSLGVSDERVAVTGNMKYDLARSHASPESSERLRKTLAYATDEVVIIGGSLHEGEDEALLDAFQALDHAKCRASLIIVPRYPARVVDIKQRVEARGHRAVLKTAADQGDLKAPGHAGILIVDTVGELGALYGVADLAFVGGSLFYRGANKGGHNLMEPAILGVPILFGPYNFSFKETVRDLLMQEAGVMVKDKTELAAAIARLVADAKWRTEMGDNAKRVVVEGQGATLRNYELLKDLLADCGPQLQPIALDSTMPPAATGPDSS